MSRWLYVQGGNYETTGRTALLAHCAAWHVSDLVALDLTPSPEFLSAAADAGLRVHVWWCTGYWPLVWYANAPASWKLGSKLNPTAAGVQAAIAQYATQLAATPGIAGISLDYFRASASSASSAVAAGWTQAITAIHTATQAHGLELSMAGVPLTDAGGFNTDTCAQPWDEWLAHDLLDRALVMEYVSELDVIPYTTLPAASRARVNFIAAPVAYYEDNAELSADDFGAFLDAAIAFNPDVALFDHAQLATRPQHAAAIVARPDGGGVEPPPPPPPVQTTTTLHFTGDVTVTISGVPV